VEGDRNESDLQSCHAVPLRSRLRGRNCCVDCVGFAAVFVAMRFEWSRHQEWWKLESDLFWRFLFCFLHSLQPASPNLLSITSTPFFTSTFSHTHTMPRPVAFSGALKRKQLKDRRARQTMEREERRQHAETLGTSSLRTLRVTAGVPGWGKCCRTTSSSALSLSLSLFFLPIWLSVSSLHGTRLKYRGNVLFIR